MNLGNLSSGLVAIARDLKLLFLTTASSQVFIAFAIGVVVALLAAAFVVTKKPSHVSAILRYSPYESFQKIATRNENGTFESGYLSFLKMYHQTKILMLFAFIAFCLMISGLVFLPYLN